MKNKNKVLLYLYAITNVFIQFKAFSRGLSVVGKYSDLLNTIIITLLIITSIISLYKTKIKTKPAIALAVACVLSIISASVTKNPTFIYLVLMILSSMRLGRRRIIKIDLISKLIVFAMVITINALANDVDSVLFYRDGEIRNTLGFIHPNTLGCIIALISIDIFYLTDQTKHGIYFRAIVLVSAMLILNICKSRTAILVLILSFIIYLLPVKNKKSKHNKIWLIITPICAVISVIATIGYGNNINIFNELNTALSGRLRYQDYYSKTYDISLFGMEMPENLPLDNSYYKNLYAFGVFGFVFAMIAAEVTMYNSQKNNDISIKKLLASLLVYSLSESCIFRADICPLLFLASEELVKKEGEEK